MSEIRPGEVYNLAAQSHVRVSFDEPVLTSDATAMGVARLLEAIRSVSSETKFYQASSSEMFGASKAPQKESTGMHPRSPYGVSKLYGHWLTRNYREAHNMFAVSGILFNHESPRRGPTFVTRKISRAVARIQAGSQHELVLGNLDARRDWGYAPEYVIAMWRMLQQDEPRDLVVGTGQSVSVMDFLQYAFESVDLDWREFVRFDSRYLRPTEVDHLEADSSLSKKTIGWNPSVAVYDLAAEMVRADVKSLADHTPDRPIGRLWQEETS